LGNTESLETERHYGEANRGNFAGVQPKNIVFTSAQQHLIKGSTRAGTQQRGSLTGQHSTQLSHYQKLVESELMNPIVMHSFDPIGGKFGKENNTHGENRPLNSKRRGKAKVIVKSTLFPVSVKA
jgi:hypothetical protein